MGKSFFKLLYFDVLTKICFKKYEKHFKVNNWLVDKISGITLNKSKNLQ